MTCKAKSRSSNGNDRRVPTHAFAGVMLAVTLAAIGAVVAAETPRDTAAAGGPHGGAIELPRDEISAERRREIERATAENVRRLLAEGRIDPATEGTVLFDWPVATWNGLTAFGFHGIANFVDQDPAFPNQLLDFNCGQRTYDLSNGYNHRGTDIFSWPNPWKYMDEDRVAVVAAAPGTIVFKEELRPDMSCGFNSLPWNAVYVRHADGSIAWYGHLKRLSATPKGVGDTVVAGEFLGIMGSSGSSTAPHLHFEVWRNETYTELLEPWQGPCNALNATSLWIDQRPYFDLGVNDLTVGPIAPDAVPPCPQIESPNEQYDYAGNEQVYFTMYLATCSQASRPSSGSSAPTARCGTRGPTSARSTTRRPTGGGGGPFRPRPPERGRFA